jgi:cellulose synthase (UDP-forming)
MKPFIHSGSVTKPLLIICYIIAIVYFSWWFQLSNIGNPYLYGLLFFGEFYHVFMSLTFWYTVWPGKKSVVPSPLDNSPQPSVAIFITVTGEPLSVIRETALAAKNQTYSNHAVYFLNDGYVAKKENWQDVEALAKELGVACITRRTPGGAKAGNINNALAQTSSDLVAIFDADMIPSPSFLEKLVPYFREEKLGFVQTPQYYGNYNENEITAGAWEQQEFFFGPIMEGKNRRNAAFICGTNVLIRKKALMDAGGMFEESIAEDFLTSLFMHQKGWRSEYVNEVLAIGLAPQDRLSYYKQQLRWARGSLEVLFKHNPLFKRGLLFRQKIQYLISGLYYFNGLIVLIDSIIPLFFLLFGLQPVAATTTSFALYFFPFMFFNLYTIFHMSDGSLTFKAISFSQASWSLQIVALTSIIRGKKMEFAVTPKQQQQGNFLFLVYPHLVYIGITLLASIWRIYVSGTTPAVITNITWAVFNCVLFLPFIFSAVRIKKLNKPLTATMVGARI